MKNAESRVHALSLALAVILALAVVCFVGYPHAMASSQRASVVGGDEPPCGGSHYGDRQEACTRLDPSCSATANWVYESYVYGNAGDTATEVLAPSDTAPCWNPNDPDQSSSCQTDNTMADSQSCDTNIMQNTLNPPQN
jgi:hypothetical protein